MPQVKTPSTPVYPEDVDWKSIDHELMYKILSLPSEVDDTKGIKDFTADISCPPDYVEWFDERAYWFSQFGLAAHQLAKELCSKYGIKRKKYNSWDPVEDLAKKLSVLQDGRQHRISNYEDIVREVLGKR